MRYGGNTTCVEVTLSDGSTLVLDAGTGIRQLGIRLLASTEPVHVLLTHLHLDHIQGLMFFAPLFQEGRQVTIWGPEAAGDPLRDRIARYVSAPLCPVEIRDLSARVEFRQAPGDWELGVANITSAPVTHRGPTLGYRIEDADGAVLCYIPDHEPGLGASLDSLADEWISGFDLARGASLLIHDCQYADAEYPAHLGWGHSPLADALAFARRTGAARTLLFHHDPLHSDDYLDELALQARTTWVADGGAPDALVMASERMEFEVDAAPAVAAA
jgi:phosphoribosyl 1,2-cyclic phosphodiesterase